MVGTLAGLCFLLRVEMSWRAALAVRRWGDGPGGLAGSLGGGEGAQVLRDMAPVCVTLRALGGA